MNSIRTDARREALAVIDEQVAPLARPGFWGRVPFELIVQDGVVTTVFAKGQEQQIRLPRPKGS